MEVLVFRRGRTARCGLPRPTLSLPLAISICQTDSTTGQCPAAAGSNTAAQITGGATPTFGIFVSAIAGVPFPPATNRIFVEFTDANEVGRAPTSVAVQTQ